METIKPLRPNRGGGIEDLDGLAVAGDGGGKEVPLVGGEVVGVFEAIGPGVLSASRRVAGQRREPRLCETSMAQWRPLHRKRALRHRWFALD